MTLSLALTAVSLIAAGFLALCGGWMLLRGEAALTLLAHTKGSLVQSFAGRYLAMAGMLSALALMAEWRALAVVLAIGGAMGLMDYYVVGRAGGWVLPHALAGGACFVLAAGAWFLSRAGG
jgi:hypothetical protein